MLRLNDVSSGYSKKEIIKKISLEVREKEILVIIGINGSGKSTLLKTMCGLIPAKHGDVLLDEKKIKEWPPTERAQLLTLLDSHARVSFPMTVLELLNISHRLNSRFEQNDLRKDALSATDLKGFEDRNVLELSSGETRRAFIAHTLCSGSKTILLDEPFAHLDWHHQAKLCERIKSWRDTRGTTFVLAIHELEWAAKIADRICVIDQGRVIGINKPEVVLLQDQVREVFAFQSRIDQNPFDGSRQLTLGHK